MRETYKMITLVGTSPQSYEEAIENAVAEASLTVRGLAWFEVKELRGRISEGRVAQYQAKIEAGFRVEGG
jgi:flavin-binding protein dodecin